MSNIHIMKYLYIILILSLTLQNCKNESSSKFKTDYSKIKNHSCIDLQNYKLTIDTILINAIDSSSLSSMVGSFHIFRDTLAFADKILSSIFLYNLKGKLIKKHMKKGKGPNELLGLSAITQISDSNYIILDNSNILYSVSSSWNITDKKIIDFGNLVINTNTLARITSPDDPRIYEIEYSLLNIQPYLDSLLIIPIVTEHIKYNGYGKNSDEFYKNSYSLAIVGRNGKIKQMFCTRSPVYEKYKYIPNFKFPIFDICQDTLYYSFEADSLIYKQDLTTNKIISFGNGGQDMRTDYRETKNFEDSDDNFFEDYEIYGYYQSIKYIPQTNLLFRSYHKGQQEKSDGLQVYHNNYLIGDYKVPSNFKVIGYIAPYYYASGNNEEYGDNMVVYKFQL